MSAFFTANASLSTTAVQVVDPADFDRQVTLSFFSTSVFARVGFTSAEVDSVNEGFAVNFSNTSQGIYRNSITLVLPADEALWGRADGGTAVVDVLVTKPMTD